MIPAGGFCTDTEFLHRYRVFAQIPSFCTDTEFSWLATEDTEDTEKDVRISEGSVISVSSVAKFLHGDRVFAQIPVIAQIPGYCTDTE